MSQRPPRDLDWIPDNSTGITVPSTTKQNAGWFVEKPARQFFNWLWNRLSRWTHYFSGQSQEFIVIDSTNGNEKDYDTLAAYIADAPAVGDKVLVKETQALTAQMIIPSGIALRLLDGITFTRSTLEANSVIKFGSDIIIEGVLNLVLSHTGTTAKAIEFNGDNVVGKINVENASTGTLTTAFHINAAKSANNINGVAQNTGGGVLTNVNVDSSAENTNLLTIYDEPGDQIVRSLGSNTFFDGFKFELGSDADGDIYYMDAGILKRLAKGADGDILNLASGVPAWKTIPAFSVNLGGQDQLSITSVDLVEWDNVIFDTTGDFDDVTDFRYEPSVAGLYLFSITIDWQNCTVGDQVFIRLNKTGVNVADDNIDINGIRQSQRLTFLVEASATDWFEVHISNNDRDTSKIGGLPVESYFTGHLVAFL